jgi:transposase-like protein
MQPEANIWRPNPALLTQGYDSDDEGRAFLESLRWPVGAVCPHCHANEPYKLTPKLGSKSPARKGLYKCRACRRQFTVTVGTIFEDSRVPISKWLMAIFFMRSGRKNMTVRRLHQVLGISYKSTHVLVQRIREALTPPGTAESTPQVVREKQMVMLRTTPLKKIISILLQKKPAAKTAPAKRNIPTMSSAPTAGEPL